MSEWGWKARIFFSVDIVGSTSYKNNNRESKDEPPRWPGPFREFFAYFPEILDVAYNELSSNTVKVINPAGERLKPWKFIGDEILFESILEKHQDALWHILAFRQSLLNYVEQEWKPKKIPLGLKATAWFAGFPVTNMRAAFHDQLSMVDYIGPQIDLGFRLTELSNARRMPLSVDLAIMVLGVLTKMKEDNICPIFFEGNEKLKGMSGDTYPLIWADTNDNKPTREEALQHCKLRKYDTKYGIKLMDYLKEFIEKSPDQRMPFIENDECYGDIPDDLDKLRIQMESEDKNRGFNKNIPSKQVGDYKSLEDPEIN